MKNKNFEEILKPFANKFIIFNDTSEVDSIASGEILEIRDIHLKQLEDVHKDIYEFQHFKRKVKEVELNLSEYFNLLSYYEEQLENCPVSKRVSIQKSSYVDINRVFTNFLASFNSLIYDFLVKHRLPKIYGKSSSEVAQFLAKTNEWYDNEFYYRFLVTLRDYAIHYDFPIYSVGFDIQFAKKVIKVKCNPTFDKEQLLKNDKIKRNLNFT